MLHRLATRVSGGSASAECWQSAIWMCHTRAKGSPLNGHWKLIASVPGLHQMVHSDVNGCSGCCWRFGGGPPVCAVGCGGVSFGLEVSCWYATMSCGFVIFSLRCMLKVAYPCSMMVALVVRCADRVSALSGCFGGEAALVGGCWHGQGLIFLPTTVQTEPALGAVAAAVAKVGLGLGWVGGPLLMVMGCDAWDPATCWLDVVGCGSVTEWRDWR